MKKISIQGFPGAFHHIAAANYEGSPVDVIGRHTFDEVITDVMENDAIDYGMMAIENSIAGSLLRNYSLIQDSKVQIVGETYLRIKQNLLALPGVRVEDLKEVHSHPIALAQCEDFFAHHPHIHLVSTFDTAESAYDISQNGSHEIGAIASSLAGEMYALNTLVASIETDKQNYTRFLVLDDHLPSPEQDFNKISISFRVSHAIGSLYKALENLSLNKCNLTKIQSVPILGEPWQYLFFADFVLAEPYRLDEIIGELSAHAQGVRVLGKYKEGQHYEG